MRLETRACPQLPHAPDDAIGSPGVPRLALVRGLCRYLERRAGRSGPLPLRLDWLACTLAVQITLLCVKRPFEVEGWDIPPGLDPAWSWIVFRAKTRTADEGERYLAAWLPAWVRPRLDYYLAGRPPEPGQPILRVTGPSGGLVPVALQGIIDEWAAGGRRRGAFLAYGLRHRARSDYLAAGLSEAELRFMAGHDGQGYERFNPLLTPDLRDWPRRLEAAAWQVAVGWGLDPDG